jgi:hypothetical protein
LHAATFNICNEQQFINCDCSGDWVALKVVRQRGGTGTGPVTRGCFLHVARVENVDDTDSASAYTVSLVKKNYDKSYSWPEEPDIRAVDRQDLLKISNPIESVVPGVALRIKFNFCADDINAARLKLNVPLSNMK